MEIRRSLPSSLRQEKSYRTHSRFGGGGDEMRDRGEYERKNPSPLIQQQFLSQSNFADCPVNREEVYFLCSFSRVALNRRRIARTSSSHPVSVVRSLVRFSFPKSQFDTFGDFIFTVICEQWQAQWTGALACLLPLLHLLPMRGGQRVKEGGVHFLAMFDAAAIDSKCEFAPA